MKDVSGEAKLLITFFYRSVCFKSFYCKFKISHHHNLALFVLDALIRNDLLASGTYRDLQI